MKIISDHQRGFTLLEGLAGLIILMLLIALGGQHLQQRLEEQLHRNVAAHLRMVANAAERYLLDRDVPFNLQEERQRWENEQKSELNNPKPPKNAPPYVPQSLEEWRYQQLIKNKYLPDGFHPTNLYGQYYALYVEAKTAPQPHQQLLVMTTEGRAIQERFLRQSARYLGRQGGYLFGKKSKKITGSQQGWYLTLPPKTLYQTSRQKTEKKFTKPSPESAL
ncbi:prepilin-type N-terminal cleavage/methylation domain-containing protein [unidentified bacterial endosymbiont]|uniref:prepilin-type N-terminal cleavage/methylation domain-containing protein n=1 Tax=unidentified bacterial endosymbiont TaxID=2355 RepID=UPI0020A0D927|nr:prepilin-type N-terminal cleavage/methylation domain-containing protein [unidentified bacterial endosymbiont]